MSDHSKRWGIEQFLDDGHTIRLPAPHDDVVVRAVVLEDGRVHVAHQGVTAEALVRAGAATPDMVAPQPGKSTRPRRDAAGRRFNRVKEYRTGKLCIHRCPPMAEAMALPGVAEILGAAARRAELLASRERGFDICGRLAQLPPPGSLEWAEIARGADD